MSEPTYLDETRICFGDIEIMLLTGNSDAAFTGQDGVYYMLKSLPYVASYRAIQAAMAGSTWAAPARNILEVGVGHGGSAPFLDRMFNPRRLVCLDICERIAALERYRERSGDVVRTHYTVSQSDAARVQRIIEHDFDGPLDLVVDDASHFYAESKATFEAVFHYLRPGAVYVLEDWTWSHGADAQLPGNTFADRDALTNLVFEFVAAAGSDTGLIESIGFASGLMWVVKGWCEVPKSGFKLDGHLNLRGRAMARI